MAFRTYRNMANRLKLKVRKFQGHIATFREVTRENLVLKVAIVCFTLNIVPRLTQTCKA